MADKLWHLRVFDDDAGVMNRSAADIGAELLVVSQFTLYGDTSGGRRPSWIAAARPEHAEPLVDAVVDELRRLGATVATGRFRTEMQVTLVNDGPVTVIIDAERGSGSARAARRQSPRASTRPSDHATTSAAAARSTAGRRASRTTCARCAARRAWRITACSLTAVRSITSPSGVTNVENPVGAACTTHRPVSIARSRLDATCWVCTIVPV